MKAKEEQMLKGCFKGKVRCTETMIILFLISGFFSYSSTTEEAQNQINTNNKVSAGTYTGERGREIITTKNDTEFKGEVIFDVKETGDEAFLSLNGTGVRAEKLNITINPKEGVKHSRGKGLIIRGNSNAEIKELIANVTLASETQNSPSNGPDSNAAYGVSVGYNHGGGNSTDLAKLTVNKMNVSVTNTENTMKSKLIKTKVIWKFPVTAEVEFGHQLSGLKVYRKNGAKAEFIANDKVDIRVSDSSSSKSGDYLAGVFVSGNESKAEFNGETNITLVGDGKNSAGIKIGKPLDGDITTDGPSVIVNGKLNLDTTANKLSGAVRLFGDKSKLEVTGLNTNEASVINSGKEAIVFDTQDYITNFVAKALFFPVNGTTSRNSNGNDQIVKLHNTEIKSISDEASLIKVKAENVEDITLGEASNLSGGQLNHGDFSNKNATFELSGDKSIAKSGDNAWLIEVQGVEGDKDKSSSLTTNIKDGAKIEGLVHKEGNSVHDLIMNNAIWKLKAKAEEKTSTLSNLTLENSLLDASVKNIPESKQILPKDLLDKIEETTKSLSLANDLKNEHPDDNEIIELYNDALKAKEDAEKELEDYKAAHPFIPEPPKAEYIIKLTSNGTAKDGTFINNGTISMANDSYEDKLTIHGKYKSDSGKLKVNTLWNSSTAGNEENFKSDLLEIEGGAVGKTEVIAVSIDGREGYIDGSIGSIKDDLNKDGAVVVRVKDITVGNNHAFEGKAKTSGAGELVLAERDENGSREYYWTITALNKEETPIYSQIVSSYVQAAKINKEMAYSSVRTLHERKSENRVLDWEYLTKNKDIKKKQLWARVIGNKIEAKGKERFNFNSKIKGVQVGNEFSIDYKDDKYILNGGYITFQEARSKFFDKYRTEAGKISPNKYTGYAESHAINLGLTRTSYKVDGQYLDLVGQVSFIRNKYKSSDGENAKNRAFGVLLSAETGKPFLIKESISKNKELVIEPQGQLIYQNLKMSNFSDGYRKVEQGRNNALRGRLGFRLSYNDKFSTSKERSHLYYAIANIWHDFTKDNSIKVGKDVVRERYSSSMWEIGLGMQFPILEKSYLYTDIRYNKSLTSTKYKSYIGTVGVKYTF